MPKPRPRLALARPSDLDTREGMAAFIEALTGTAPSQAELDEAFPEDAAGVKASEAPATRSDD